MSISPHMEVGVRSSLIAASQQALHHMMLAEKDAERQKIVAASWFRAVQYTTRAMGEAPLTCTSSVEDLVRGLDWVSSYAFRHELAAVLLSCRGKEARKAVDALVAQMRKPPNRPKTRTGIGGKTIEYLCGPPNHRRIAAALLKLKPKPDVALEAHVYLLQNGLVHEQWQAIDVIRQHQEGIIPGVEKALVGLATDKETDRELRQEAVTTMGMLKTVDGSTLKALRGLATSADKGMAVRAKAALQQLKGRR